MNRLLLATRSANKACEIREILKSAGCDVELVSLEEARVAWSSAEEEVEDQDSFLGNARKKAEYFCRLTGLPTVADDSGIEVIALLGRPGVKSRRFALNAAGLSGKPLDAANNAELLRRLRGTGGFGYDPLFFHEGSGRTFAELTPEEKHTVSHRGEAFRKLAEALKERPLKG